MDAIWCVAAIVAGVVGGVISGIPISLIIWWGSAGRKQHATYIMRAPAFSVMTIQELSSGPARLMDGEVL